MMLPFLELGSGIVLLWSLILPAQNYAIVWWLGGIALLLWVFALAIFRTRALLTCSMFFHFCLLLAFHARAISATGPLVWWYAAIFWTMWIAVLWFYIRHDRSVAALFICIVLVSPLYSPVLDVRNESFIGVAFWILAVTHGAFVQPITNYPKFFFFWLAASLLPVPFALYYWRAVQFFWIQLALIFLYCGLTGLQKRQVQRVVLPGYLFLGFWLFAFAVARDAYTISQLGSTILGARHHIVEHANTLAPVYIIWSSILLYCGRNTANRTTRIVVLALILALACLEFLTYSRSGWAGYVFFLAAYGVLTAVRRRDRIPGKVKQAVIVCFILAAFIVALQPIRQMFLRRALDTKSAHGRLFAMRLGVESVLRHPLTGTGWFNYYSHSGLLPAEPLQNILENSNLRNVHNHSMFLDLAEAGGFPLMIIFIVVLVVHMRRPLSAPVLTAGLIGVTANNVLDTASLWMTVYPHFWILLGLRMTVIQEDLSPRSASSVRIRTAVQGIVGFLLLAAMLGRLLEDRFIQTGRFLQINNRSEEAIRTFRIASILDPLDVSPLERMRDAYLTRQDVDGAEAILKRIVWLKKKYAPYYVQWAELKLARNEFAQASAFVTRSLALDPHATLAGNPHILDAQLQFLRGASDYKIRLYRAMIARPASMDSSTRSLLRSIPETSFVTDAIRFVNDNDSTASADRAVALEQLYLSLRQMNESDLSKTFLESAWSKNDDLPPRLRDTFCYLLAEQYFAEGNRMKLEEVSRRASSWAVPYVQAYKQLANGNLIAAKEFLDSVTTAEDIDVIAWKHFWEKTGNEEKIRTYHEVLQRLPSHPFTPGNRREIANSYFRERKFADAANQFRKLTFYDYSDPGAHWLEARMWWLADDYNKAEAANSRLQRLIPTNPITKNLYRCEIRAAHPDHFTIERAALENKFGGMDWRTAIYAHPFASIALPPEIQLASVSGQVAMRTAAWFEQTDGFVFSIENSSGHQLLSIPVNPVADISQRRWLPFHWSGKRQNLNLLSSPRESPDYDWALVTIQSAE